jgi:hypothetical protein
MAANPFDRACRHLIRRWGASLLAWLAKIPPESIRFVRWLDTRLSIAGLPERFGDNIAFVVRLDRGGIPWVLLIEFQVEPDPEMFERLLVYAGLIRLQEKPTDLSGDRFEVQAVVVNLTGVGKSGRKMVWKKGAETRLLPVEWNLEKRNADAILKQIARGQAPRALLAWIPLMQRGDDPGIMARWRELAEQEPDAGLKADLTLALVFAELAGRQEPWKKTLEGFNVRESSVVNEWKAEGKAEGRAEALRDLLEMLFGQLPAELVAKLTETHDANVLRQWTVLAARVTSLEQFRRDAGI